VESAEGALEAAEDELSAKAEELWEGDVGGLEADLGAVALGAAEAEAALETAGPRRRPRSSRGLWWLAAERRSSVPARSSALELSSEEEEPKRRAVLSIY
jgi:hypothetical protein